MIKSYYHEQTLHVEIIKKIFVRKRMKRLRRRERKRFVRMKMKKRPECVGIAK